MKKNTKLCFLLALCLFAFRGAFAQTNNTDSLIKVLEQQGDSTKIKTLLNLAYAYGDINTETGLSYGNSAIQLSQTLAYPKFEIRALQSIAYLYSIQSKNLTAFTTYQKALTIAEKNKLKNYSSEVCLDIADLYYNSDSTKKALKYYNTAIKYAKENKNKSLELLPLNGLATLYYNQSQYDKSLAYYMEAMNISETLGNKGGIAQSMQNIGNVHFANKNFDVALTYYQDALKYNKEIGNKEAIAGCTNNIGVMYEQKKMYDKALDYYLNALVLKKELKDKRGTENTLLNIGNIYSLKKNTEKAIEYYTNTLIIGQELNDKNGMALVNINLGKLYLKEKKHAKALAYLKEGLRLSKELNRKNFTQSAYEELAELYSEKKDYKSAYKYQQLYTTIKDTILNEVTTKNIAELQTKYETEKKDQQISILNAQQEKQKVILFASLGGVILFIILSILLFTLFRTKEKSNLQLSAANNQLELSKQQILDSINYAKTIQDSILPSKAEMKQLLPNSFIFFQPKDIVSGDFYWVSEQNERIFLALADCTGHGVPGAFMSMVGNTLLNEVINNLKVKETAKILTLLNEGVIKTLHSNTLYSKNKDGMAITLLAYDKKTSSIEIALAGQMVFYIKNNEVVDLKGIHTSIGENINTPFVSEKINVEKGMSIYLTSDGFLDQFGGKPRKKFTRKRFKELILSIHKNSMEVQQEKTSTSFNDWKGKHVQIDDVLVIGIHFA